MALTPELEAYIARQADEWEQEYEAEAKRNPILFPDGSTNNPEWVAEMEGYLTQEALDAKPRLPWVEELLAAIRQGDEEEVHTLLINNFEGRGPGWRQTEFERRRGN